VAALKHFLRKGIAVHPLHFFVFGVAQNQTVVKSEMTLVPCQGLQFQGVKQCLNLQIIKLITITPIMKILAWNKEEEYPYHSIFERVFGTESVSFDAGAVLTTWRLHM
jgi:hypothetical protein